MKEHRKIRNEFDEVVGRFLYRSKLIAVIDDIEAGPFLVWEAGDDTITLKQAKNLRRQLKSAIKRMK